MRNKALISKLPVYSNFQHSLFSKRTDPDRINIWMKNLSRKQVGRFKADCDNYWNSWSISAIRNEKMVKQL